LYTSIQFLKYLSSLVCESYVNADSLSNRFRRLSNRNSAKVARRAVEQNCIHLNALVSNTTRLAGPGRAVQPQLEICADHIDSGPVERLVAFNKTIFFLDAAAQLGMQIGAAEAVRFSLNWLLELHFEATTLRASLRRLFRHSRALGPG
jgi:hypothetical protein